MSNTGWLKRVVGVIKGKLIIHWFDNNFSVNGKTYLSMLKEVLWPKIEMDARRSQYWFQQDGAPVHISEDVRNWLNEKFEGGVISRLMENSWPKVQISLSWTNGSGVWQYLRLEEFHLLF